MSRLSASKIDLARRCGWGFRPDAGKPNASSAAAAAGHEEHGFIEATLLTGDETPKSETHKRWLEDWWSKNKGVCVWNAERKIALNPLTGETRFGPDKGDHRDYSWAPYGWLVGTVDAFGLEERNGRTILRIIDWKTGLAAHIREPREAGQMLFLGLAFYRHLNRFEKIDGVSLEYVLVNETRTYELQGDVSRADLAAFQTELTELAQMIDASPEPVPGHWCRSMWCGYYGKCPATAGALTTVDPSFVASPYRVAFDARDFESPEHAAWQYALVKAAQARLDEAMAAVKEKARTVPLPVGEGRVYGAREKSRETVDIGTPEAVVTLHKHVGRRIDEAVETKKTSSKARIDKVLSAIAKETGSKAADLKRACYADLAQVGALRITTYEELTEYELKGLEVLDEA